MAAFNECQAFDSLPQMGYRLWRDTAFLKSKPQVKKRSGSLGGRRRMFGSTNKGANNLSSHHHAKLSLADGTLADRALFIAGRAAGLHRCLPICGICRATSTRDGEDLRRRGHLARDDRT